MRRRRTAAAFVIGVAAALSPPAALDRGNVEWLGALDAWSPVHGATSQVVLVVIDADTERHPAFAAHPRADWSAPVAQVVDSLLDAGAAVIALDLILPRDDRIDPTWLRTLRRASREGRIALATIPQSPAHGPSVTQVAAAGGNDALASVNLFRNGGVVRTVAPDDGPYPALATAAVRRLGRTPTLPAPLAAARTRALIAWSATALLDCPNDPALRASLADKAVFVGAWLPYEDLHPSALRRAAAARRTLEIHRCTGKVRHPVPDPTPGVLLHALAADAWLAHSSRWASTAVTASVAISTAAIGTAIAALGRTVWTVALLVAFTIVATAAFQKGLVLPLAAGAAGLVASTLTYAGLSHLEAAWRFTASLPRQFQRAPDATEVRTVTACFADIESFTATSEQVFDPAALARDLGACLQHLAELAERSDGFVDKYLGDGLLVLFGLDDPDTGPDDAVAAVHAWFAACGAATPLRIGGSTVQLRVGLATGQAHIGTLGHTTRIHFTAIGDCINVAARLEQLNRQCGTRVLADRLTAERTAAHEWQDLGNHALKGRRERVRVFALNVRHRSL